MKRRAYVFVGCWSRGFVWCAPFETLEEAIANRLSAVEIRLDGSTVWLAPGAETVEQQMGRGGEA